MRNSPLSYIWKDDKLIGVILASNRNATDTLPNKLELELVRIFHEWGEFQDENKRLKEAYNEIFENYIPLEKTDEANSKLILLLEDREQMAIDMLKKYPLT